MKQAFYLSAIVIMMLFVGCQPKKVNIGFLMDHDNIERWKKDKALFSEEIQNLGGEVWVEVAGSDATKQYEQALNLIGKGADVLVIVPVDLNQAGSIAQKAFEADVPVISYDRLIKNGPLAFYISTNNIEIGELQAKSLTQIKASGRYVLISGPSRDNNAILLRKGWYNILQPGIDNGSITIVKDATANAWAADEAYFAIKDLINTNQEFDAIIAGNDVLASGALMAMKEYNLEGKILLAGQDAELEALRNIVVGNQTITIAKPIDKLAKAAAQAAMNVATGKNFDYGNNTTDNGLMQVPTILLQARAVNKKNIVLTIQWDDHTDNQNIYE